MTGQCGNLSKFSSANPGGQRGRYEGGRNLLVVSFQRAIVGNSTNGTQNKNIFSSFETLYSSSPQTYASDVNSFTEADGGGVVPLSSSCSGTPGSPHGVIASFESLDCSLEGRKTLIPVPGAA